MHKEVPRKVPNMTNSMNLTATRTTNRMITNKISDKAGKCARWHNRIIAYLREIAGRVALGTSWMPKITLLGYQFRSVVPRQIGIRAPESRMLHKT